MTITDCTENDSLTTLIIAIKERNAIIAERIKDLRYEAEQAGEKISIESLRSFACFLQANSFEQELILSLTPDGEIYAVWRKNKTERVSRRFLANGEIKTISFSSYQAKPQAPKILLLKESQESKVRSEYEYKNRKAS